MMPDVVIILYISPEQLDDSIYPLKLAPFELNRLSEIRELKGREFCKPLMNVNPALLSYAGTS